MNELVAEYVITDKEGDTAMIKDGKEFLSLEKMLEFIGHTQEFCDSQDLLSVLIYNATENVNCCQEDSVILSDDELSDVAGGVIKEDIFYRRK